MPHTGRPLILVTASLLPTVLAQEPASLAPNGSFEKLVRVPGVGDSGGKRGRWMLHGGPSAPAEWTLSGYFGGELTVLSEGASEGERYLRVKAGVEREAHLHAAWPGVRTDRHYRLSLRYRGGPVMIKAYEYRPKGGPPHIETIATGPATGGLESDWTTVEGEYSPYGIINARLVAAVQTGCVADIDDFRVWEIKYAAPLDSAGWLNVRHFGASGSAFETVADTTASSSQITVEDVGDFEVGQGVMISKCRPRYAGLFLRGPESYYRNSKPAHGIVELRGFDGSGGDWLVFVLDIDGDKPLSFRWSDDLARSWKGRSVPITWDWQKLSGGLEVKFLRRDLKLGHGVTFSARTQLVTEILKIEGNTLWLRDAPTKSVRNTLVRHCDAAALQSVIKRAIQTRHNVYIPNGYYRLEHGLTVSGGSLRIEGASGVHTVMDISAGAGSVFRLHRGTEVTIRNFRMLGHTGFDDKPGTMRNATGHPFWCCALKSCNAVTINGTERVLCENVHAYRMASEAFYCQGPRRTSTTEPATHTKSLIFRRCSVTDCAANAFNNNDVSENTIVEYCRIDGAAWHAYEGPGRFIKLIGNYVRNAGPFTVGDMNHRLEDLNKLGCGALALHPCRTGRRLHNTYVGNVITNCSTAVQERREGLWEASLRRDNLFTDCTEKTSLVTASAAHAPSRLVLRAPEVTKAADVDGRVAEWPWNDKARVIALDVDPAGHRVAAAKGLALAAHDHEALYLAMRLLLPKGAKPETGARWGQGDGVEVAFMNADPKHPTPIFLLWGRADGTFESGPYGGASPEQVKRLEQGSEYAARQTDNGWACEWRIPFAAMGIEPAHVKALHFNAGVHCPAANTWIAWVATGAQLYLVDQAGSLHIQR